MGRAARNKDTGLTDKEEVFAECLANNPEMSNSDAYREAYNCGNMKPLTVNSRAYDLSNSGRIADRVALLRAERSKRTQIDADWVLLEAVDLYRECRIESDRSQANKSLDTIGKHVDVKAWDKSIEINTSDSLLDILEAARLRAIPDK